jgi:hypothetical protein
MICPSGIYAQNFIGLPKSDIAGLLKTLNPQFRLEKNAVNHAYRYMKYVDRISDQTILFFLSDQDMCTYVRWMADYSNLSDITEMLNRKYNKNGQNTWSYTDKGVNYAVTLLEEEWYFTVSFRKN